MAAPVLFPDDPNLQRKTVLADNDVFLIGSPADGNLVRGTTLASIKASMDIPEEFTVADIPLATTEADGLMSSEDKTKLDGLSDYTHPATHSLDMITETETLKVMTAEERDKLAAINPSGGSGDVYLGTYTTPQDMLASDAEVGQYCYLELDSQKYPVFCIDEDPTVTTSWFAVGGGSVSVASEPPIITSAPMQVARSAVFYRYQIEATNSPINFSVTGLPTGLTCNPYTGLISGYVSSAEGVYPCTAYASNLAGTGSSVFSITIANTYMVEGLGLDYAFAFKKLSGDATNAIEVRNGAGVLADIGFDAIGNLDVSALLAHCGAGNGYVTKWYNQGLSKGAYAYMLQSVDTRMPIIVSSGSVVRKAGEIAMFDHKYSEPSTGCGLQPSQDFYAKLLAFRYAFENVIDGAYVLINFATNYGFAAGDKIHMLMKNSGQITSATTYYEADQIGVSNTETEYYKDTNMHTYGYTMIDSTSMRVSGFGASSYGAWGFKGYLNCVLGSASSNSAHLYTQIYNELNQ